MNRRRIDTYDYAFTYTFYYGDIVIGEVEVQVKYTFTPRVPARIRYDENDHPAEGPEIDIVDMLVEDWPGPIWRTATEEEFERFSEYVLDKHFEDMEEEASNYSRGDEK